MDFAGAETLPDATGVAFAAARGYREVIAERDRAEKANQAKDEFLAILSHELRNPLTLVLGWTRALKERTAFAKDREAAQAVESIERNARLMTRLVEDCLDLARIAEGTIRLEMKEVDLNEVVREAVAAVKHNALAKGLVLRRALSPFDVWVRGDRLRLEQVLLNLLSNAVKCTDRQGLVSVSTRRVGDEAELAIYDTGKGIAPEFLEQIFEPFRCGTGAWLHSESGLGLGLAIARQIVEKHSGRIWAESEGKGKGSAFRARFPLIAAKATSAVGWNTGAPEVVRDRVPYVHSPRRILLIEDSCDILFLTKLELEQKGFVVLSATDGRSGLALARQTLPDVIVSDIKLPGVDGLELIRELRGIPELASTPAVALSGFGMRKDVERALAAGYDAHLTKPVDSGTLSTVIAQLESRSRS